jgi:hypothetical protein
MSKPREAKMKKMMLWRITVVALVFLGSGCATVPEGQGAGKPGFPGKSERFKWVNAGTLVSVGPAMEATYPPGQLASTHRSGNLETQIFGDTKLTRTRVETTEGVYLVGDKIAVVEKGVPVIVGYDSSGKYPDRPSYLVVRDKQYEIVR